MLRRIDSGGPSDLDFTDFMEFHHLQQSKQQQLIFTLCYARAYVCSYALAKNYECFLCPGKTVKSMWAGGHY